jgi:tetratricopeptide (TPR) repeat protein
MNRYEFERKHYISAEETMATARYILRLSKEPDILLLSDCYRIEGRLFNESNRPLRTLESSKNAKIYAKMAIAGDLTDVNDSRMPRILTGWGNALNQLGRFEEAVDLQLEALKMCRTVSREKSDAIIIVQLNWAFLLLRMGDLESAERILRATVEADPQAAYAIYPLGNTYLV